MFVAAASGLPGGLGDAGPPQTVGDGLGTVPDAIASSEPSRDALPAPGLTDGAGSGDRPPTSGPRATTATPPMPPRAGRSPAATGRPRRGRARAPESCFTAP